MGTAFIQFQKKLFIAGLVLLFGPVAARADDALLAPQQADHRGSVPNPP